MPATDLPLEALRELGPHDDAPADLEQFWRATLRSTDTHPLLLSRTEVSTPLQASRTWDVVFRGFDAQPVHAWLQVPARVEHPVPAIVQFHGYSTTRSIPLASAWIEAGYAHLQMDNRGQGWQSPSLHDLTPDQGADAGANSAPGLLTRGVQSPETWYYRRLCTDAVRMVEVARELPEVAADALMVQGSSQGGGLAIATAGLCGMLGIPLAGAMPDVPFLCSFRRGVDVASQGPYREVEAWLQARPQDADQVFRTLAYGDGVHLAPLATCPALFSIALRDPVCPPSTSFPAFNAWGCPDRSVEIYPWNEHEGGRDIHLWKQLEWVHQRVG